MKSLQKNIILLNENKYDIIKLKNEANKYISRLEFRKNNKSYYNKAKNLKLLDELFKNHPNNGYFNDRVGYGYWTEDKLQEEANKYKTRTEFKTKNKSAYNAAKKLKILYNLFKNHYNDGYSNKRFRDGYWTEYKLQEEANKYKDRTDFRIKSNSAYIIAHRKNIIDNLFKNHYNDGYIDRDDWKENSYVIYVYELLDFNKAYIGLTNNVDRRDKEHLFSVKDKLIIFCKENNISLPKFKILEEKLNSNEAREKEKYWLDFYKENEWIMLNINKPGSLGFTNIKWTKKALQREADKYQIRTDFHKNSGGAYNAAKKLNILDEIFKNHPNNGYFNNKVNHKYWNKEKTQEEADKYSSRSEFRENNESAYMFAIRSNILNELFKNHINNGYKQKRKNTKNDII